MVQCDRRRSACKTQRGDCTMPGLLTCKQQRKKQALLCGQKMPARLSGPGKLMISICRIVDFTVTSSEMRLALCGGGRRAEPTANSPAGSGKMLPS